MKESVITLEGLTKYYGSTKVVDHLDLKIRKGEVFGLLGPNGAGKTTTILMMLGLTEPTSGKAYVCNHNASTHPIPVKKIVGYMPDSIGFYDNLTAFENLVYIGKLNGLKKIEVEEQAHNMLKLVGLGDDAHKKTGAYSRGMKQRLGLAEVLIKRPEIIILDEPTLGIDPSGVNEFLELIRRLSIQQQLTVLLSSHHLNQVQRVCDRIGIFVKGQLLVKGAIDKLSKNLFADASYAIKVTLKNPISKPWKHEQELLQMKNVQKITIDEDRPNVSCGANITPAIVRFFVEKGYDIMGVQKKEYGLEDIYQKYFEHQ